MSELAKQIAREIASDINGGEREDQSYPVVLTNLLDDPSIANEAAFAAYLQSFIDCHLAPAQPAARCEKCAKVKRELERRGQQISDAMGRYRGTEPLIEAVERLANDYHELRAAATPPDAEQRARAIVESCKFGYAGNEIDRDAAANPDIIEVSEKWLVERIAAALPARLDENKP